MDESSLTQQQLKLIVACVFNDLATELIALPAAGPCRYWNLQLADRLSVKALTLIEQVRKNG